MAKYKISAQYLKNYGCYAKKNTGPWAVNITVVTDIRMLSGVFSDS